jgi:predicted nucleic acid-binding protein
VDRQQAAAARRALSANFPETRYLGPEAGAALLSSLPSLGLSGGAVYDALVGATAREHNLPLITRDRRAIATYRALDINYELVA